MKPWLKFACLAAAALGLLACALTQTLTPNGTQATPTVGRATAAASRATVAASASVQPKTISTLTPAVDTTAHPTAQVQVTLTLARNDAAIRYGDPYQNSAEDIFVLPYDTRLWEPFTTDPWSLLRMKNYSDCQINDVPGRGMSEPNKLYYKTLGDRLWWVYEYDQFAYYNYQQFLELRSYQDPDCRAAQEKVLAGMVMASEFDGGPTLTPLPPTPVREPIAGFNCPTAPKPRLRPGDRALIVTDLLWLRSGPRASTDTQIQQFKQYAGVNILVTGEPVCGGRYVYWPVEVSTMTEGSTTQKGWMAEGDLKEYYLEPYP